MLNHLHIVQNWLEVSCILKLLYIHSLHILMQIQNGSICVNQNQLKIWYKILIETCMFSFPHQMILYSKLSIIKYTFTEKKNIQVCYISLWRLLINHWHVYWKHGHMRRPERSPDCTNGEESAIQRYRI